MVACYSLLEAAARQGASDIHLAPGCPPVLRVCGELRHMSGSLTADQIQTLAEELIPSDQRNRLAQDGAVDVALTLPEVGRLRINIYRLQGAPALAIRRIALKPPTLEELNLPVTQLRALLAGRRGLVLVTGPAGSGKSSTLAAMVHHVNLSEARHIIALEDPIEYVHQPVRSIVTQREIGRDVPSFAHGIRAALRQDPDVLQVGEMRDAETILQALQAAETGHLVLATLHSCDATSTIDRIIHAFPADQSSQVRTQLAATLQGVLSQRLFRRADGPGQIPAVELLMVNQAVRHLIRQGNTQQVFSVIQTSRGEGMCTMADSVRSHYTRGLISQADYQARQAQDR